MKKGLLPLIVFVLLSVYSYAQNCAPCGPAPCNCSSCDNSRDYSCGNECDACFQPCIYVPCFYGRADAVLWNIGANNRTLVERLNPRTGNSDPAFDANDFGRSGGSPRILLGMNLTSLLGVEGQYNGFQNWQSTKTLTGAHDLRLPGALGEVTGGWGEDFFGSDRMTLFSETSFHSAELNLVRRTRYPSLVWLAGFRYFNFEENFDLMSAPFANQGSYQFSNYAAATTNNLYGGQLGAKWDRLITDRFGLQAVGKTGVYSNEARQKSYICEGPRYDGNSSLNVPQSDDVKKTYTSLSGEVNLGGYFKVTRNVSIVGGYNFLWIGDVARAADQLDFDRLPLVGRNRTVTTDTLFLHGASVGVEWNF
ncbi:MAG: BBP7 family outer membrane beta-barrel protein [Planctomycetaceae bacterium]|nr:BBP7 family outer membrane beta-barrel protein [Planctomycetaceae bacterium]